MDRILGNFENCCIVIQEFYAILGKDLKTVVGKADIIDSVTTRVKEQVNKLENFENDVYSKEFEHTWDNAYDQFQETVQNLEQETAGIIDHTFENRLSSSEGAFDLLAKFKNVKTRKAIEQCFNGKYQFVMRRYNNEIEGMESLFLQNEKNPPIPKNMPPTSGSICWARSIISRIKSPIDKFKTKPEILTKDALGVQAAKNYVRIAKQLTESHEQELFRIW